MRFVIPEEFISDSQSGVGKCDVKVPMVGDLVNRRSVDRFPFITMDERFLKPFDKSTEPELAGKYRCMDVADGVFELQASTIDLLTGRANGFTEVLDLQDIRAGCSAYIAAQVISKKDLLQNGGMMYQYTKYLTSEQPMVESMRDLIREHSVLPQSDVQHEASGDFSRETRDLDLAAAGISGGAEAQSQVEM